MAVAVGEEDQGPLAVLGFEAVGVELRLLLAVHGIAAAAFGLHQGKRLAVVAPEHVIDETLACFVRHALHLHLIGAPCPEPPAHFLQVVVDVEAAGCRTR